MVLFDNLFDKEHVKPTRKKKVNSKGGGGSSVEDFDPVFYAKMNDQMYDKPITLEHTNAMSTRLLRTDGFSYREIDDFKNRYGRVVMPGTMARISKSQSADREYATKKEIDRLDALIPCSKVIAFDKIEVDMSVWD
jgi:hypothetical protein